MVDTAKTRSLFEPIISKPPLTDQLLQRPPFKFIHDVVNETVRSTGVLKDLFTADDLDYGKAGADKASKIAFLEKVIDGLNADGSLNDVKPSRIVAGKDAEYTNLLLQALAIEAASSMPSKHRSKSKDRGDKEKKKKSKSSDESKPKKSKRSSSVEKEKKEKDKDKEKEKKEKKKSKSKEKKVEEIIEPVEKPEIHENSYVERESSGGTSKGGDDSGIAEETGAESERHDFDSHSRESSGIGQSRTSVNEGNNNRQMDTIMEPEKIEDEVPVKRPTTGAVRPQTAMGRPGTAAARPAPPKVKKTKVADLDPTAVSQQSSGFDKSVLLMEEPDDSKKEESSEDFIVEEEEEAVITSTAGLGADISELTQGSEHGQLVNRIIENTRKLEDDASAFLEPGAFYDLSEQKKMKSEVEAVQRALQSTAQSTNPLARSLDFIVEDFDLMLKEIEDNRKLTAKFQEAYQNRILSEGNEIASISAHLRSLNNDIKDVKAQIANVTSKIIENEKKIHSLLII